jgi:GntR family transcriptional regulator
MRVDPASGVPIYLQVADGVREDVASGALPPGAEAPSLRQLAADLRVNYHTIARAYHALEEEGVLVRQRGGAYVVADVAMETAGELLRRDVEALCRRARALGCGEEALLALVRSGMSTRRTA